MEHDILRFTNEAPPPLALAPRPAALRAERSTGPTGIANIGNTCYLATAAQCLLALNPVRSALRACAPQLRAAAAAARASPPARNTTPDGTVSAALADACDHVWGGGNIA